MISGTAGVGKTALAVRFAHQAASQFPGGQLYVDLRGFGPAGQAVSAGAALRGFLDAFGVAPLSRPATVDAQAALYRSLLAGRRMLIVLDNARDSEHARPLIPGTPGCLVLATSRSRLTGLVTGTGARPVSLDLLTTAEARELLAAQLGQDVITAQPQVTGDIIAACARLPLALAIVAARAAARPAISLEALAGELADAPGRLDALAGGEAAADARAVLSWSYQALGPAAARLFRLLSLHPGPDASAPVAASLAGVPLPQARRLLDELSQASMTAEHAPGRHVMHDLLRDYAAELTLSLDSPAERDQATGRLLDHYLHVARDACQLLYPYRDQPAVPTPRPGTVAEALASPGQAFAWFTAEHLAVLAAAEHAASTGHDACACQLLLAAERFLIEQGRWHELASTARASMTAASRLGDPGALAPSHLYLGIACTSLGHFDDARAHLRQALTLYRQAGDQVGQARARIALGVLSGELGRQAEALAHDRKALALHTAAGNRHGQGLALNNLGYTHALLGDYHKAIARCQQALAVMQELGDRLEQANTWHSLGYASHHLGRHVEAARCYRHAAGLYHDIGNSHLEGLTLTDLGDTCHAAGDPDAARAAWEQAAAILAGIAHPDAAEARARIAATPGQRRPARPAVLLNPSRITG